MGDRGGGDGCARLWPQKPNRIRMTVRIRPALRLGRMLVRSPLWKFGWWSSFR